MFRKLFSLLLGVLPVGAKDEEPQAGKLGAEGDPIRQMLFASQSMAEILSRAKLDGTAGPLQGIAEASALVKEGRKAEAVARLRRILETKDLESRMQLWVWSCLRELGGKPEGKAATEVLGVVLEVPSGGAYDTLAAYEDGRARYLNFSGKAIFWESVEDAKVKGLCALLIQAAVTSSAGAGSEPEPRTSLDLPRKGMRMTLLTRSGLYAVSDPKGPVMGAGAKLMMELISRTKEQKKGGEAPAAGASEGH